VLPYRTCCIRSRCRSSEAWIFASTARRRTSAISIRQTDHVRQSASPSRTSHRRCFVTSRQPDEPLDTDIVLDPQDSSFAQTGLQVRSTIRIDRLLTVASAVIKRSLSSLSPSLHARVADGVHRLFTRDPHDAGVAGAKPESLTAGPGRRVTVLQGCTSRTLTGDTPTVNNL
jgi:hypothetical protein